MLLTGTYKRSNDHRLPNIDPIDVKPQEIETSKTQTQLMALGLLVLSGASARARALSGVDEDERGGGDVSKDHSRLGHGGGGELALEGAVPVVLDGVVGAAEEEARDGGPAVAEPRVGADDGGVLLGREGSTLW